MGYAYTVVGGLAYTLVGAARSPFVEGLRGTLNHAARRRLGRLRNPADTAAALGAFALFRAGEWRKLLLLGPPLAYLLLIGSGHEAWAHFRVPLEPLMTILAAFSVLYFSQNHPGP